MLEIYSLNNSEKEELKTFKNIYYFNKTNKDHIIYRFKKIELIGKGSFSKVYKVEDYKNKCKYAIKQIEYSTFSKIHNIYNEIEILQSLKKKEQNNITKLFEYFFFRKDLYIVLKLYYSTLHDYINGKQCTTNNKNHINYIKQLTNAIDFLNKNNVIHRDIKPNNIVFKDNKLENIILIDFGNSCFSNRIDYRNNLKIQTINYRAPEVIINSLLNHKIHYNYKIDIWSLGCVIYELFFKKRLFDNNKNIELFVNYNIIFNNPGLDFLTKFPELHKYYDDIENPSYIKFNNKIYGFKKDHFIKKHEEHKNIIELVIRCCEWNIDDRIDCKTIIDVLNLDLYL